MKYLKHYNNYLYENTGLVFSLNGEFEKLEIVMNRLINKYFDALEQDSSFSNYKVKTDLIIDEIESVHSNIIELKKNVQNILDEQDDNSDVSELEMLIDKISILDDKIEKKIESLKEMSKSFDNLDTHLRILKIK